MTKYHCFVCEEEIIEGTICVNVGKTTTKWWDFLHFHIGCFEAEAGPFFSINGDHYYLSDSVLFARSRADNDSIAISDQKMYVRWNDKFITDIIGQHIIDQIKEGE